MPKRRIDDALRCGSSPPLERERAWEPIVAEVNGLPVPPISNQLDSGSTDLYAETSLPYELV